MKDVGVKSLAIPLFFRAIFAILLTGLISAIAVTLFQHILYMLGLAPPSRSNFPVILIRLFLVQLALASSLAIMIELPKTIWFVRRRKGSMGRSIALNVGIGGMVFLFLAMGFLWLDYYDPTNIVTTDPGMPLIASLMIFLFFSNLMCSAFFWWRFVIAPEREKRSAPVVAAQFE